MTPTFLVLNGDFETGALSPGWTDSSDASGEAGVVLDASYALQTRGGWNGAAFDAGAATSDPFLLTRTFLRVSERSESSLAAPHGVLRNALGVVVASWPMSPTVGASEEEALDVTTHCGATATIELSSFTYDAFGAPRAYTLFDDVAQAGPACPDYDDGDGDGACEAGLDLDGDGDCDGPGEPASDGDCDDADPTVAPGAPEVYGDGVDQACDGVVVDLRGTVSDDSDGDGTTSGAPGIAGVVLDLWADGGDLAATGLDDVRLAGTATAADGTWSFPDVPTGARLWVVVQAPRTGAAWAEQTRAGIGALCATGLGTEVVLPVPGPCFGGRRGEAADAPATLGGAEHVLAVDTGSTDVRGLDTAFSHAVVTNDNDGQQGSLRQWFLNGVDTMRFTPAVPPDAGAFWSVATASPLPDLARPGAVVDGTAFCNGILCVLGDVRDPNDGPELEVDGGSVLVVAADAEVRDLALYRTGVDLRADGASLVDLWIGPRADGTLPTPLTREGVIVADGVDDVAIDGCWVRVDADGVLRGTGDALTIAGSTLDAPPGAQSGPFVGVRWLGGSTGDRLVDSVVSGHGGPGVVVLSGGVEIAGSSFFRNTGPAIDLGGDGVTPDGAPVLAAATHDGVGTLHVEGNVPVAAVSEVEVYLARDDGDQDAHGEPEVPLGTCATDPKGVFACDLPVDPTLVPATPKYTALATRDGATSEAGPNFPPPEEEPPEEEPPEEEPPEEEPPEEEPPVVDADGDGLLDDEELALGTDPLDADTDDDGLDDFDEVVLFETDPLDADSDGGGVDDGAEVSRGSDPNDAADDFPVGPTVAAGGDGGDLGGGGGCATTGDRGPVGVLAAATLILLRRRIR